MSNVQFEEQTYDFVRPKQKEKLSGPIIKLLKRFHIANNDVQASRILILFILVNFLLSIVIVYFFVLSAS